MSSFPLIHSVLQVLHPDDFDGHKLLKAALPQVKWTTGEHEYTRYGFRKLIEGRSVDIIQPDVMWLGGMTEVREFRSDSTNYNVMVAYGGD